MNNKDFHILSEIIIFLKSSEEPVSGRKIAQHLNNNSKIKNVYFTDTQVRKYINTLRAKTLAPVIACKRGYFISFDKNDILTQMHSLGTRAAAMTSALNGLAKYLHH